MKSNKNLAAKNHEEKSPYLNARIKINDKISGVMNAVITWQIVGVLCLLIAVGCVGGIIKIGSQSKFIPLVYQLDNAGNVMSVTRADRIPDATEIDTKKAATDFIENIRLVTADNILQRKAVLDTYAYLQPGDPAIIKANEYLNGSKEQNPFNRAAKELVNIEIKNVVQPSPNSWQIDWIETTRNRDGTPKIPPVTMRAIVTVYQSQPNSETTEAQFYRNPHFVFVKDFSWSKQF